MRKIFGDEDIVVAIDGEMLGVGAQGNIRAARILRVEQSFDGSVGPADAEDLAAGVRFGDRVVETIAFGRESPCRCHRCCNRQFNETAVVRSMVDTLRRLAVVGGFGPEDVRHERLWIAVVNGEPARLDLHHDAVPGTEDVVGGR